MQRGPGGEQQASTRNTHLADPVHHNAHRIYLATSGQYGLSSKSGFAETAAALASVGERPKAARQIAHLPWLAGYPAHV